MAPLGAQAGYLTDGLAKVSRAISSVADVYSPWGPGQLVRFYEANMYPAAIDAIVPTLPFLSTTLRLRHNLNSWEDDGLAVCDRKF